MTEVRAPRPTDLVALVSFDDDLVANEAVTRDRLGRPPQAPHPLSTTIQRWLGLGRRIWIDVRGRQVQGIATARELAGRDVWEIDTLVDAARGERQVTTALLVQAAEAAAEAGVGRLLLRVLSDAPAVTAARRAGFVVALQERLWSGRLTPLEPAVPASTAGCLVRESEPRDAHALFQLHSQAMPIDARQAMAMTFQEWEGVQDRRWAGRGTREYVAVDTHSGAVLGSVLAGSEQFTLLVERGAEGAARALLHAAALQSEGCERILALLPECASTPAAVLHEYGLVPGETFVLLALRTASVVREAVPARAGAIPTSG